MDISKNPFLVWVTKTQDFILKYKKEFIIGLIALVILILGSIFYYFYKDSVQKRAQRDFVSCVKFLDAKVDSQVEKWTKVEQVFKKGYQDNKGSGLAPIFLAYQADALLKLDKAKDAVEVLQKAVSMLSSSALKSYYQVKLALVKMDLKDQESLNQGLEILKNIALKDQDLAQDLALFRLGEYYWFNKNYSEVKNYWGQLIAKFGKDSKRPSIWSETAEQKLKLIKVK